ncbi:hypothetical protein VTK73DRAFT_1282 [Phialemonium thermophilum]|uniref:Uncharacterized protein n=1 Tax=Phialemonium thermophilum TaxID=223376 RepID=A0ABR3XA29_9PEZI
MYEKVSPARHLTVELADIARAISLTYGRLADEAETRISGMARQDHTIVAADRTSASELLTSGDSTWGPTGAELPRSQEFLSAFSPSMLAFSGAGLASGQLDLTSPPDSLTFAGRLTPLNSEGLGTVDSSSNSNAEGTENDAVAWERGHGQDTPGHTEMDVDASFEVRTGSQLPGQGLPKPKAATAEGANLFLPPIMTSRGRESSSIPVSQGAGPNQVDDIRALLTKHISDFSLAVFESQAQIAGVASATAEYVSWARKIPARNTPAGTCLVPSNMLEGLEDRLREISAMAETKPVSAFRDMVVGISRLSPDDSDISHILSEVEGCYQRRFAEVSKFFQTRYDACALLSKQSLDVAGQPVSNQQSSAPNG